MDSKVHSNVQSHQDIQFPPKQLLVFQAPQISLLLVQPTPTAMNWSHFKPEFSGKPCGNPEVHLLRTIDLMDNHNFSADHRVQRFP